MTLVIDRAVSSGTGSDAGSTAEIHRLPKGLPQY